MNPRRSFARLLLSFFLVQTFLGFVPRTLAAEEAVATGSGSSSSGATVGEMPVPAGPSKDIVNSKPDDAGKSDDKGVNPSPNPQASLSASNPQPPPSGTAPLLPSTVKQLIPQSNLATGALTYSYPLTVPPGRNGMAPQVSLTYNSQNNAEGSIVGYGWNVDIPSIERVNKTGTNKLYTDNYFSSSLSGELVNVSGSSYRAKVEGGDFLEYAFSSNAWTVKDKKGTVYKFGTTAASRQDNPSDSTKAYKWMLEEVRDLNDNYVRYEYYKNGSQIYPSKIKYTGYGSTDGIFEVEFLRQARTDASQSYYAGFLVTTGYRINEIQARINGTWVRKYALAYTTGDNGHRSLLSGITASAQQENGSGQVTLPPVSFQYQAGTHTWTQVSTATDWLSPFSTAVVAANPSLLDANGDAWPDYYNAAVDYSGGSTPYGNATWLNDSVSSWNSQSGVLVPPVHSYAYETYGGAGGNTTALWDRGVRLADLNGDILPDVAQAFDADPNEPGTGALKTFLNTAGSSWTETTAWHSPVGFNRYRYKPGSAGPHSVTAYGSYLLDLNADGLSDVLQSDLSGGNAVASGSYLNTGSSFGSFGTLWSTPSGASLNPPFSDYGDLNGDGLTDLHYHFYQAPTPGIDTAYLNDGQGNWIPSATFKTNLPFAWDFWGSPLPTAFIDLNGDGLSDALYGRSDTNNQVLVNTGHGWREGTEYAPFQTYFNNYLFLPADVNADGLIDFVNYVNPCAAQPCPYVPQVYLHNGKVPDLLTVITYPEGGSATVSYKPSSQYKNGTALLNPNLPFVVQTVNSVVTNDAFGTTSTKTYLYEGGKYAFVDSLNRKFAGFSKVTETDAAGGKTVTYYHQGDTTNSSQGEYSDHFSKIGRAYRIERLDSAGNKYAAMINKWDRYDLGSGASFVKLIQTISQTFDGNAGHKDTASEFAYDNANGNLTTQTDWGEVTGTDSGIFTDIGSDKFTTSISYASNTGLHILGLPSQQTVTNQSAAKVNESKLYYDTLALGSVNKGNLTKQEQWKTGSTYVNSQKAYNAYGLPTSSTDPRGKVTTYAYDTYNLYPATVTNPLTQATTMLYDYSSGAPWQVTDVNGLIFQTYFDGFDRPTEERQPDQTTPATLVTKATYEYTDTASAVRVKKTTYLDATTLVDSYTYFDGLGRPIQTRSEAEDANAFAVTDTVYNNIEQVSKTSLPYFSTGSSRMTATTNAHLYTTLSYDAAYRVTSAVNAVGTTSTSYDDWKVTVTDPRGKNKSLTKDAQGNLVKVEEFNSGNTYTTLYEYDGNKNLTKITDALGNVRNFTYDGLSRRLTAQDLHASADATFGTWTYAYDDAGNLTQTVDPKAQTVNYVYDDLNRVTSEDHTGGAGTEATYAYDTCTRGVGKLCTSTVTGTTTSSYQYSPTGQVSQETENTNSQNFVTSTTYDRQGNVLEITNPDSSKVKYTYNAGGLLETVQRKESTDGSFVNLVTDMDYGPHGGVTYQANANGTNTTNTYDATKLYRLSSRVTVNGAALKLQDIAYTYDANGNVLTLTDNSGTNSKKTVTYTYDDLNRLLTATSSNAVNGQDFNETYAYDAIGNITSKTGQGTYAYAGTNYANPHAVTSAGSSTFSYDNDGNLTSRTVPGSSLPWYSAGSTPAWYVTGGTWINRKQVTIDYTKVSGGSNLSNFTVLVNVTDAELKHTSSGGMVGKTDGSDILFTASDGITKLSHEIEKYDGTAGQLIAWVKVPTLSATANTKLLLYYGNAAASDQQDKPGSWDSNTKGTWHLKENPTGTAPQMKDSTSSAYNGTSGGSQVAGDSQAGKIANALNFDGSNDVVDAGSAANINNLTNNFTVSAWVKPAALSGVQRVIGSSRTTTNNGWGFGPNGTDLRFTTYLVKDYDLASVGLATNTWQKIDAVMSSNNVTFYVNGVNKGTVTHTTGGNASTDDNLLIGNSTFTGSSNPAEQFNGLIDELKVSNTPRSAGWITTEYNNQNSPGTFSTIGAVQGTTWTNRKQVTIDYTKVSGGSNLTNFTALVNVTDASLKTVANGGSVGKSDGTDILFTSSDGTTKLSHEIEKYDATTGNLVAWVKVPTLSASANTVLVLYYGNATAADQQDRVNTYDANTKGVWHLGGNANDSTSNANNATSTGTSNATGKVGDGESVTGANTYLQVPNHSSLKPTSALTVSAWIKRSGAQADYAKPLWFGQNAASPWGPYGFQFDGASDTSLVWHVSSNSTGYWSFPSTSIADNTWYHVTGTYDGSSIKYYINGSQQSTQSATFTIGNYDTTNGLGLGAPAALGDEFGGTLDEIRVSSVGRSAGWITTEYNNQNSPGTFATLSDVPAGSPVTTNYTYDYRNRMTGTSGAATSSYGYDVSGERVKTILGGVTTISPTRGYSLEGSTPIKQIFAGSTLVATVKGTGASAAVYTVATDHLTGSNAVSTSAGALEELMDYYPYGFPRLDEKAGSFNEKRKFAGHEYDTDTGLSYMVARYYDGAVGRFYAQDQLFWSIPSEYLIDPQQQNGYSYARNNPMYYIDADGRAILALPLIVLAPEAVAAVGVGLVTIAVGVTNVGGKLADWALGNNTAKTNPAVSIAPEAYGPPLPQAASQPAPANNPAPAPKSGGKSGPSGGGGPAKIAPLIPAAQQVEDKIGDGSWIGRGIHAIGEKAGKLGTIVQNAPGKIAGFTGHGVDQAISRGVSPQTILDTITNPQVVLLQSGGTRLFLTQQAGVVVNTLNKVVTTYGKDLFKEAVSNLLSK